MKQIKGERKGALDMVENNADEVRHAMPSREQQANRVTITAIVAVVIVVLACLAACTAVTIIFLMNAPWSTSF